MPRKTKRRRRTARPAIAPWIVLAGSLAVIGFACTRTPPATQRLGATQRPPTHSTAAPAPSVTPEPAAAVTAAEATATPAVQRPAQAPPAAGAPPQTAASLSPGTPAPSSAAIGSPPTNAGATPVAAPAGGPRLALIIDDCGQWLATERGFIALPIALTMSVLPDVRFNHTIEREAVDGNKGVMLHLPMETLSGLNPGPGKITTEMGDSAIATQVEHDLDDVDLARGVNNHEGSKATANPRVMNDLMSVLAQRGRFFIDSKTSGASVAERVATAHGVASAGRDVFIDNRADVAYTERQLREAAAIARRDGSAIAIGHPRPTTLVAVRAMIPELEADGITFTLASNLVR